MKSGRRVDSDVSRRDVRERDFPGRYAPRKRPSMLSEFHGKHYNHREINRDGDAPYFRAHGLSRYGHDPTGSSKYGRYGPGAGGGAPMKPLDVRQNPHAHHFSRLPHHHHPNAYYHNDVTNDLSLADARESLQPSPAKRPHLLIDVSHKAPATGDAPNSADSVGSSIHSTPTLPLPPESPPPSPPQGAGLSAYLEDIDSDDEALLREEEEEEEEEEKSVKTPSKVPRGPGSPGKPTKDELLQMMERVDRDIAATESQITALLKKQAELEESAKHPSTSPKPPTPLPKLTSPDLSPPIASLSPPSSPEEEERAPGKLSLVETVYAENRLKARSAQMVLGAMNFFPVSTHSPLYSQPCEAPCYLDTIARHVEFRPKLVAHIQRRKLAKHRKELELCRRYDALMADWEKRLEKTEMAAKKKARDAKAREVFEKTFPELKTRREQQERFNRVDQRGFGVVRSDAELKELMYELYEQEEASVRYRRTHAIIPSMIVDERENAIRFCNSNGLIPDPMGVYREQKLANSWTDEEKRTYKEKYLLYPKNFEMVASFLPNKTTSDCVKYYYISKKNESLKRLVRKASLKRRKAFVKPQDLSLSPSLVPERSAADQRPSLLPEKKLKMNTPALMEGAEQIPLSSSAATPPAGGQRSRPLDEGATPVFDFPNWSQDEIEGMKLGLTKFGRAWGKVCREVGSSKTAMQCKRFYDENCGVDELGLNQALADHSSIKNAEKAKRKAESRRMVAAVIAEAKRKQQKPSPPHTSSLHQPDEEADSENTESASETESCSGDEVSESESTITDSGPEEEEVESHQQGRGHRRKSSQASTPQQSSEGGLAFDLFISAAEALSNTIPSGVALHDHSYSLPPTVLANNVDGLSLIAAAAAVVSPTLSRSAGAGKLPSLSPVRAPRGRPPNSQKRGSTNSTKLAPTFLSPIGSNTYVPLSDVKPATFRGRTRSAPAERPRSTVQLPRVPSTLTKISISSGGKMKGFMPPGSYPRRRDSPPTMAPSPGNQSLKSMIAAHPQHNSSNAAFEALVNVAVAQSPVELPKTAPTATPKPLPLSFHPVGGVTGASHSSPATPIGGMPPQPPGQDGGTTTAFLDVNQAISLLALASISQAPQTSTAFSQHQPSAFSAQPLFTMTPALSATPTSLLGTIVSQSVPVTTGGAVQTSGEATAGSLVCVSSASLSAMGAVPTLGSSPIATATCTMSVETLLSHILKEGSSLTATPAAAGGSAIYLSATSSKDSPLGASTLSLSTSPLNPVTGASTVFSSAGTYSSAGGGSNSSSATSASTGSQPTLQLSSSSDELSNLNLLSSLVAAVAAQSPAPSSEVGGSRPSSATLPAATTTAAPSPSLLEAGSRNGGNAESASLHNSLPRDSRGNPSALDNHSRLNIGDIPSHLSVSSAEKTPPLIKEDLDDIPSLPNRQPQSSPADDLPRSVIRTSLSPRPQPLSPPLGSGDRDELPRCVVRTNPHVNQQQPSSPQTTGTEPDVTTSMASIIPHNYNSSQSTLLLYARSITASAEASPEEEDHLESATRGISELSRLLGTDTSGGNGVDGHTPSSSPAVVPTSVKGLQQAWGVAKSSAIDGLSGISYSVPAVSTGPRPLSKGVGRSDSSPRSGKAYLSTLLESHGTLHTKSPSPSPALGAAGVNNSQSLLSLPLSPGNSLPSPHTHVESEQSSR